MKKYINRNNLYDKNVVSIKFKITDVAPRDTPGKDTFSIDDIGKDIIFKNKYNGGKI